MSTSGIMRNTFESSEDGVHVNGRRISRYAGDLTLLAHLMKELQGVRKKVN